MRRKPIKEIKKSDFVLLTFATMFFVCGAYNEFYYKEIVSKQFDQNIMLALMAVTASITVLLLMRSNVCRNMNTAIGTGIFPAIICMMIANVEEYKFQIISTIMIVVLSTLRSWIGLSKADNIPDPAKAVLIVRYAILLTSTLGLVALLFITE